LKQSDRNIRRALLMLEAARISSSGSNQLAADQVVQLPDWELYIGKLAREILQEQTPSKLLQVRDMLYELLTNCIPADIILNTLTKEILVSFLSLFTSFLTIKFWFFVSVSLEVFG
jgi:replication factor C subunit 3/5